MSSIRGRFFKHIASTCRDMQPEGSTTTDGKYSTRGFCGEYKVSVKVDGKVTVQNFVLTNEGKTVEVVLK